MKNVRLMGLAAALIAAGCDGGSSIDIMEEPPGDNCATGGFRIETDGQVFYSCDEAVTVEDVAAGEDGNTCVGDAVRVTFPSESGAARVVYVCQTLGEADPEDVAALTAPVNLILARNQVECACTLSEQAEASCEQSEALYGPLSRVQNSCIHDVLALAGPSPVSFDESVGCQLAAQQEVIACIDLIEIPAACNEEIRGQLIGDYEMCQISLGNPTCEEADVDVQQWQVRVGMFASLLDCPLLAAGSPALTN